jgi:hypothetical protein
MAGLAGNSFGLVLAGGRVVVGGVARQTIVRRAQAEPLFLEYRIIISMGMGAVGPIIGDIAVAFYAIIVGQDFSRRIISLGVRGCGGEPREQG